ncbi:putative oxidoreductase [Lachnellula subtilissima]|uniref:Putative oxidoreductase n=1 Tax=Lachnellula subtilissima TaxID=602034 RepID=A0A8H8UD27_9HELO|nr:putative oxidoreductase [Lachnellula subtilissima]
MASLSPKVWLITGCSTGLGASLAIHALKAGHTVIATARNPSSAPSYAQITSLGGKWLPLDVNAPTAGDIVQEAVELARGRIDVLVNNAGYSILGAMEDISDEEAHAQLETNFFGPLRLIRAVLPAMREQNAGTIVNVSSVAGVDSLPSSSLYAASKFALEGMSEGLAREVSPFGIRVLIVEPGAFRTQFLASFQSPRSGMNAAYENTPTGNTLKYLAGLDGTQRGDAEKGVSVIFDVVMKSGVAAGIGDREVLRLPLGSDCVGRYEKKVEAMKADLEAVRGFVTSLDIE